MLGWPVRMYRCAWSSEAGEIPALSRNGGSQASGEDEWDEPGRLDPRVRISPRLKGTRRLQVAAQRLIGIGVGPGDPELITIKAIQALQGSAPILVPATEASAQGPGRAETIVAAACPEVAERIVRVPFSMADSSGVTKRRAASWQTSADAAVAAFANGAEQVGFATIGDPSVYSTFSYLADAVREQLPQVLVEVVPGITAMQALAAASGVPLVEGDEILALVPLKSGVEPLLKVAEVVDTCVVYKAGRHLAELRTQLAQTGGRAIAGINVGLPEERLVPLDQLDEAPYFTSVLWPPQRGGRGERL